MRLLLGGRRGDVLLAFLLGHSDRDGAGANRTVRARQAALSAAHQVAVSGARTVPGADGSDLRGRLYTAA